MEEVRNEAIELLKNIENERLLEFLKAFIEEAIKAWG